MLPIPKTQLITYPDSLGGDLAALSGLLEGPRGEVASGGIHILPPYPSSADRGFSPISQTDIDPRFGDWPDIESIARGRPVSLDLMVNHVSRQSPQFQDFLQHGRRSVYADMFQTVNKIWRERIPNSDQLARLVSQNPNGPVIRVVVAGGEPKLVWTTFGSQAGSEQVDLDLRDETARRYMTGILGCLASHGVSTARLNAVGYAIKKAGTSCFMVQPETDDLLDWFEARAEGLDMSVIPDVHASRDVLAALERRGHWVYDHALPGLILHAIHSKNVSFLAAHLADRPAKQLTVLDTHDGIPVRPDLDDSLPPVEIDSLVQACQAMGATAKRLMPIGGQRDAAIVHQLYTTYYSALGRDDDAYLLARAIQLFSPGIPQIYYVGVLAGDNDSGAAARSGEPREANRHNYTTAEVEAALDRGVVQRLLSLVEWRNRHPAFEGRMSVSSPTPRQLEIDWRADDAVASLIADFATGTWRIAFEGPESANTGQIGGWIPGGR